jgi:hypothetical protein
VPTKKKKEDPLYAVITSNRIVITDGEGDPLLLKKELAGKLAEAIRGSFIPASDVTDDMFPIEISDTSTSDLLREWVNLTSALVQLFRPSALTLDLSRLRQRSKSVVGRMKRAKKIQYPRILSDMSV